MSSSSAGASIGTAALDSAADDFQHTWQYGLKQIKSMVSETGEGVGKAHDAYQETDVQVATMMRELGGVFQPLIQAATPSGGAAGSAAGASENGGVSV